MVIFEDVKQLNSSVIDEWSSQAEAAYLKAAGKRAENTTKLKLSIEEVLLRFRDLYGTDEPCRIRGVKRIGRIRFEIIQKGVSVNPLQIEPGMELSHDILAIMDINPKYTYRSGKSLNIVTIPAAVKPKKNALLLGILISVILSILTYFSSSLLPDVVRNEYLVPFISLLFTKFTTIFSALATPLVFCAVISGICGIGDVSSFGKLGGYLFKRMMLTYFIAMGAMVCIGLPMGITSVHSNSGGGNVFLDLLNLVLDIIPGNIIEPFRIDNDLQVIVIAIFVGVIMLILGEKVHQVREFVEEAGTLINRMMVAVCKLLPLFVYLGFTHLLLSGDLKSMGSVSKIVVITLAGAVVTIIITIIRALIVTKQPLKKLFSDQLPSLLINLTTSSQVSALPESMKCCKEKWRIDERLVDFGLPLGIVVYMPNGAIMLGAIVWVLTALSSGAVDPMTLVKLVFVSVIIAIAAPPIPGSAFAVLPILFSACGTDISLMPLAIIVGSTVGYLLPAMNGYCLQLELLMTAIKTDKVKR